MLDALVTALHASRGIAAKRDIAGVVQSLGVGSHSGVPVGDDCAAIPDGDGWLLFAIEGFIHEFVERDPWFAGWCGVMVNVSDIYAMGGRPIAVVDAVWSRGGDKLHALLDGMTAASRVYQVPVVGGHSNLRCQNEQLAVSVMGRANRLLTSFDAKPGDVLMLAIDLRGAYREPFPHWNCTTDAPAERLRGDLELLPALAEEGLCAAAKDVSQAGIIGTAMMLLECSGVGAVIDVDAIPHPPGIGNGLADKHRWLLSAFPSFGFILSVAPDDVEAVAECFRRRDIACAAIGVCDDSKQLHFTSGLASGDERRLAWNFVHQTLIGCA